MASRVFTLIRAAAILGLSFACPGCKKQLPLANLPSPTVQAAPPVRHDEKLPEPPAPQTSAPVAQTPIASQTPSEAVPPPPQDAPKKPKKKQPRKSAPTPATVQIAKVEAPVAPSPPPPVAVEPAPRLEQLLSPGQEQSYNQTIDRDLQRARNNLKLVQARNLSESQQALVVQVQTFIKQAEDRRKTDLVEAKGLSHKADILASDLARSLQ